MNIKNKFQGYIVNLQREGFYSYFITRFPLVRKLRYQLVGLLYSHAFHGDIVKISQLEYFCDEIANQDYLQKTWQRNKELTDVLCLAKACLSTKDFAKGLSLLRKAVSLDPYSPSLLLPTIPLIPYK